MRKLVAAHLLAAFAALFSANLVAAVIPPTGLSPGTQYQLIFATADSINALSPNIADYNNFVTTEAALNPSLPAGVTWSAVVSAASLSAAANAPSIGLPVYNTQGIEVASAGLYTPAVLNPIAFDQFGNASGSAFAWTGSEINGSASPFQALGDGSLALIATVVSSGAWTEGFTGGIPTSTPMPIYALSSVITVPRLNRLRSRCSARRS